MNGESIYATKATLFGPEAGSLSNSEKDKDGKPQFVPEWKWRSTAKGNKVYVYVFEWPNGSLHLEKMPRTVTGAYFLADPSHKALKVSQTGRTVNVSLPAKALDPIATVVVLTTK